jgi:transaldolase/glucose-6-phosphate isomerase
VPARNASQFAASDLEDVEKSTLVQSLHCWGDTMETKTPATEAQNPIEQLRQYGQSIWLDFISRGLIDSGELAQLVNRDRLGGVTSNPAIFQKAIDGSDEYTGAIAQHARSSSSPQLIFEKIAVRDIRDAADVLSPMYRGTSGRDGYVSLEVAPDLAHDTHATIDAARRLWSAVARPNVMIKVPGTAEGLPAVLRLLSEGINVNITLLFGRATYEKVAATYLQALEQRVARGEDVSRLASVASFFVSRIDSAVDGRIAKALERSSAEDRSTLQSLKGKVAIANAKLAYQSYKRLFSGPRWEALRAQGALPQRVLWASTSVKNRDYRDVMYVEELIGADTVNTMPPETLAAFRDHGRPRLSLESDLEGARRVLAQLERLGISLDQVTDELVADGIQKFAQPYREMLAAIERRLPAPTAHA